MDICLNHSTYSSKLSNSQHSITSTNTRHNVFTRKPKRKLFFLRMKGKLQLLFTFFYFAWAPTQTRLLPMEAPTSNYTSTNLFLFSGNNQRDAATPQRTLFSIAPPYHADFSLNYRMNQTLTTPYCLWLGFINQHLHYDSELDSIANIHKRYYNSIFVHFSLFIIKTKHI